MNKLWQKNKKVIMDKTVEKFLTGDDLVVDIKLAKYDIQGSLGHLYGLLDAKIINQQEFKELKNGLLKIGKNFKP